MASYNRKSDIKLEKQPSLMEKRLRVRCHEYGLEQKQSQPRYLHHFNEQIPGKPGSIINSFKIDRSQGPSVFEGEVKETPSQQAYSNQTRKNVGGRKPMKCLVPEEEEKRAQRREKNKLAAARCRKRRLDHTNQLLQETECLQNEIDHEKMEICKIEKKKEELQIMLDTHNPCFYRMGNKREMEDSPQGYNESSINEASGGRNDYIQLNRRSRRERPTTLPVQPCFPRPPEPLRTVPKPEPPYYHYESFVEGGTGLTPPIPAPLNNSLVYQRDCKCIDLSSPSKYVSL